MDLGRYIHQLLRHRKEVYVKGLGVFKRMHTPSVYDERKGQYLPPVTYLEFDGKGTGGVDFIDYFQQAKELSRSDAELEVESAVLETLEKVRNDGIVRLSHVGHLVRHGSSLVFKAEDLGGFQLQPIAAEPASDLPVLADADADTGEKEEDAEPQETVFPEEGEEADVVLQEEMDSTTGHRSKWYLWVAVSAAVVIAGLFYFNRNTQDDISSTNTSPLTSDTTAQASLSDTTLAADPAKQVLADDVDNQPDRPLVPEDHRYQVVIGTHATLAQAYNQAESFNKAGVESVRVIPSKLASNKKRVIWDTYLTKAEADSALRYVRRYHVSDAWHQQINQ